MLGPNKRVLVLGKSGQLARSFAWTQPSGVHCDYKGRSEIDLSRPVDQIEKQLREGIRYDAVINTAAYTDVEKAEDKGAEVMAINAQAMKALARVCRFWKASFIHFSTDYVFDGRHNAPYTEKVRPAPLNFYGLSKWEGEKILQEEAEGAIIIRTSWLYSPWGKNFLTTMMELAKSHTQLSVVADQVGTPTSAISLAKLVWAMLETPIPMHTNEIYHLSCQGVASWYDFAEAIFEYTNSSIHVQPIASSDYPSRAARPAFSLLDKTKWSQQFAHSIPYWRTSLRECLDLYRKVT